MLRLNPAIRVLSREQALKLGLSAGAIQRRLTTGQWIRLLPGVFATTRPGITDRCRAALLYAGDGACLSGSMALHLRGIRRYEGGRILVLTESGRRPVRTPWLLVRPTARLPTPQWSNGLAIAPPARAVADWSLERRCLDDVRATVARGIQRDFCTVTELVAELAAGPRNGSANLRQALDEVRFGARSAPEARAARVLTRAGLGPFEQNVAVGPFFADFLWRELRAILEIDSVEYHFDAADWAKTLARHRELESMAYSVIHVPPSELRDEPRFLANVGRWLESRRRAA